ncbi:MAG: hypothetical protein HY201_01860 [Nitrospirae bacterium]|nr:hypothetical protein [Candidatus Troglogloeales bacterium]
MGAAEATWIYQNGTGLRAGDKVFALAVPLYVKGDYMQSERNGVEYKAYCGFFDIVCSVAAAFLRPDEIPVDTGFGISGFPYIDTHDRLRYQIIIGLPQF